jgi:hypothetical protein
MGIQPVSYEKLYSVLRLFTGFATAAFIDCELTVTNAMITIVTNGNMKYVH